MRYCYLITCIQGAIWRKFYIFIDWYNFMHTDGIKLIDLMWCRTILRINVLLNAVYYLPFDIIFSDISLKKINCIVFLRSCSTIDQTTACTIATSLVHFQIDYATLCYSNCLHATQTNRLQLVINFADRTVTKTLKHHRINPVLKSLHWFKIHEIIKYVAHI